MFGGLKKRLKEAVEKVSKTISSEELKQEVKQEQPDKAKTSDTTVTERPDGKSSGNVPVLEKEPEQPVTIVDSDTAFEEELEKKIEELEELREKVQEEKLPPEIAEGKAESEMISKEEKRSFFSKITEKKLTDSEIEKIMKELNIALLENDVAVGVADKISDDVKKELLGTNVKRGKVDDVIRDALKHAMLDVMKQDGIDIQKRIESKSGPFTVMFVGFNGVGKCISGDTLVPLANGDLMHIEDLYERAKLNNKETAIEDGYIIKDPSLDVFSVNPYTLKMEKIQAKNIWKLRKDKLLRVVLNNGQEIKVTPEHPFFVLKPGTVAQKRAGSISSEDYLMVPRIIETENRPFTKLDLLNKISNRKLFIKSETLINEAYKIMEREFGSLEKAFQKVVNNADWTTFRYYWKSEKILPSTIILELAKIDRFFVKKLESEKFLVKFGRSKSIMLPDLNEDFYNWLGLFYAEGHMARRYVEFTNSEDWLLDMFSKLTESVFGVYNVVIRTDKRFPNVKNVIAANTSLVYFVEKALGMPFYKKSTDMKLPEWVLRCSNSLISSFLKSYWESDGSAELNRRVLEAATASREFAIQHSLLLLRFGIIASFGKRIINGKSYYRITIVGKNKIKTFRDTIGFLGPKKQERLENLVNMNSQFEKTELIPMQAEYLKGFRESMGILQKDMADSLDIGPSLLSQYERGSYQVLIPIERMAELAAKLSSPFLEMLANSDVRWIKVRKVEEVTDSEEWVYDFTIPGYHNFVANNFIVHNTTSLAKLAYKLKKYKPVLAAADTFRAASIEQLEEHGRRLNMRVVKHQYGSDAAAVIFDAKKHAEAGGNKLVLADTAGRSHSNVNLMDELKKIARVNQPDLKILVLDSVTGNDIYDQCRLFDSAVGVDAIILTKADVYERGGAALSAAYTLKKPILYIGVGQEYEDLKEFNPEEIVKNLL